jgi:glutaminyl-tRNA synthetase
MPTLCGLRRRGYTPASIHNFSERNGVAKINSVVDYAFLEYCLREDLNEHAKRAMAVIRPVKLIIDNYPEGQTEEFEVENNPKDESMGTRKVSFSRELWIEAEDFMEVPAPKYFRLYPGNEVRLKSAYIVKCVSCDHDADGNVTAVHCEYDESSRGGNPADGRKIKSTIHWVNAADCIDAEIRLYDRLFTTEQPDLADCNYLDFINPESLTIVKGAKLERSLENTAPEDRFQFLRNGYFCADSKDSKPGALVFNKAVSLKDSYKPEA